MSSFVNISQGIHTKHLIRSLSKISSKLNSVKRIAHYYTGIKEGPHRKHINLNEIYETRKIYEIF